MSEIQRKNSSLSLSPSSASSSRLGRTVNFDQVVNDSPQVHEVTNRRTSKMFQLQRPRSMSAWSNVSYTSTKWDESYGCNVSNKTEFLASAELTEEEFQENPIINWEAILWGNIWQQILVCGIQHFQRAGHRHLNLFQSTYYVVVTFSTVGYALIVLPTQFEQLAFTWMERQKLGGSYSSHRAQSEKHVVVCSTTLHADTIMDFLNEFYAHPLLQDYYVVLLSPMELDTTMRMILQVPIWAQRVIYIQGSCLKDGDLARARMNEAEACFILAARNYADKTAADEHTILRSWAVKDFAPSVPQYVQIFREGQQSPEEWHRLYGKCSGNEIYHIVLGDSRFFGEYEGKSFTYASFHSHRKYGVALVGVRPAQLPEFYEDTILLNPGPRHIMKKDDTCYYMSITKEENSAFVVNQNQQNQNADPATASDNPTSVIISDSKPNLKDTAVTSTNATQTPAATTTTTVTNTTTIPLSLGGGSGGSASGGGSSMGNTLAVSSALGGGGGGGGGGGLTVASTTGNHLELPQTGSRRPSILPVPDMFTSSSFSISGNDDGDEGDESDDEIEDDVPWRSPCLGGHFPQSRTYSLIMSSSEDSNLRCCCSNNSNNNNSEQENNGNQNITRTSKYAFASEVNTMTMGVVGVGSTRRYQKMKKSYSCDSDCVRKVNHMRLSHINNSNSNYIPLNESSLKDFLLCHRLLVCEHCGYRNAKEYQWQNKTIILAADYASNGIYNFIIPLRAHFRSKTSLNPIILLLERRPDLAFLDALSYFPLVYWMLGSIDCLDDLLRAGITLAESVVVVNKELSNSAEEDSLADCNTIVAVQTMFKFFPSIKSITELSQSSNMRFMQFRAHDKYALHLSKMEKREKERGSHISYMFRLPFAAGAVFSASMLDTLLYQAFVKDYVITFMRITKDDMWIRTYGRLYQKLCSTTCEIPIGIYRTQDTSNTEATHYDEETNATPESSKGSKEVLHSVTYRPPSSGGPHSHHSHQHHKSTTCLGGCTDRKGSTSSMFFQYSINLADEARDNHAQQIERAEIANLVRSRMESLNLPTIDYDDVSEKRNHLSYVIINPSCDLKLEEGDLIYLVRPSPFSAQKTFERHNSRRKSNISFCSNINLGAACGPNVSSVGVNSSTGAGSRRGSGMGLNPMQMQSVQTLAGLIMIYYYDNRISLQVTPPEEPTPILGVPCVVPSGQGGGINPSTLGGGSTLNINNVDLSPSPNTNLPLQLPQDQSQGGSQSQLPSPQHLQGTIV
ncbi:Potassium channel subfamily T member 1 [Lucilia cuprina]|nr:Potassium channel subfamily T member 1 [Lucilia cuprina]